ncbi:MULTISPECIES: phage head closure protein [Pseudomonas]|uniref:phage head closure protein n=1 Tax=Pseudomonas TaxID=286 RepID=UPI001E3DA3EF|nr:MULTISPECIES: phage head closure protein [Pseudomonas]MCE0954470.1 phage head closure protein [Pseudomonas asiatica]
MQAGKLRYPVTIERPVRTRTPDLELVTTWELVGREWADIESISGSEFIAAQAPQSQTVFRIRIRYRDDLVSNWRIREGARVYEITAVLPDARRRRIELMCKTGEL